MNLSKIYAHKKNPIAANQLKRGDKVKIIEVNNDWSKIRTGEIVEITKIESCYAKKCSDCYTDRIILHFSNGTDTLNSCYLKAIMVDGRNII